MTWNPLENPKLSNSLSHRIVTGSGDANIMLWDLTSTRSLIKEPTATFYGHVADVGAIDTWRDDINTFVSGSQDGFAKLWDIRVPVSPVA
jgi:guanine nucleotide-binding protein G(I)/G(S)/G(T) subunit beta-1